MTKEVSGRIWSEGSEAQRNPKKRQLVGCSKKKRSMKVVRGKWVKFYCFVEYVVEPEVLDQK